YLDQRLGVAGTRRDLAAWHSWHCTGTGLAVFGLFRPRVRGRFAAGGLNLAVLFVRSVMARRAARRLAPYEPENATRPTNIGRTTTSTDRKLASRVTSDVAWPRPGIVTRAS